MAVRSFFFLFRRLPDRAHLFTHLFKRKYFLKVKIFREIFQIFFGVLHLPRVDPRHIDPVFD